MIGERAQHGGQLVDVGAAAAQRGGHAGLDEAGGLQGGEVVGDEAVLVGRLGGAAGEQGAELAGDLGGARRLLPAIWGLVRCSWWHPFV